MTSAKSKNKGEADKYTRKMIDLHHFFYVLLYCILMNDDHVPYLSIPK
jgi:hypothetical protein